MSIEHRKILIKNEAQWPMRNLVVAHANQVNGKFVNKQLDECRVMSQSNDLLMGDFVVDSLKKGDWVVAWENSHDLAVYYLVMKRSFWKSIGSFVRLQMDYALAAARYYSADTDRGQLNCATAANNIATAVFESTVTKHIPKISHCIKAGDQQKMSPSITLHSDRKTATFQSSGRKTACDVKFYLKSSII